jgi:HSP90 family molecular chaperone
VLYLTDPVDEAMVTNMQKYGELELVDVSKEGLKLDDSAEETKKTEEVAKEYRCADEEVVCLSMWISD